MSALRRGAALLLMLAGCVAVDRQDYPADWSPLAPAASGCPVLSGRYANRGHATVAAENLLSTVLIGGSAQAHEQVEQVELDGPASGGLEIRLFDGNGRLVAARRWQEGTQYKCAAGMLTFNYDAGVAALGLLTSTHARLARTVDGSLVVERGGSMVGAMGLAWPVLVSGRSWSLHPAVALAAH